MPRIYTKMSDKFHVHYKHLKATLYIMCETLKVQRQPTFYTIKTHRSVNRWALSSINAFPSTSRFRYISIIMPHLNSFLTSY